MADTEIGNLMNDKNSTRKELESAEAHVTHLTEQLIEYDKNSNTLTAELESKRMDISELLGFVEKLSADQTSSQRKNENLRSEIEQLRLKMVSVDNAVYDWMDSPYLTATQTRTSHLQDANVQNERDTDIKLRQRIQELEDQLKTKMNLHNVAEERLRNEINKGRSNQQKLDQLTSERGKFDSLDEVSTCAVNPHAITLSQLAHSHSRCGIYGTK